MLVYITAILDIIGEEEEKKKKYKYILEYIHIYSSYHIYTVGIVDQNAGLIYER